MYIYTSIALFVIGAWATELRTLPYVINWCMLFIACVQSLCIDETFVQLCDVYSYLSIGIVCRAQLLSFIHKIAANEQRQRQNFNYAMAIQIVFSLNIQIACSIKAFGLLCIINGTKNENKFHLDLYFSSSLHYCFFPSFSNIKLVGFLYIICIYILFLFQHLLN